MNLLNIKMKIKQNKIIYSILKVLLEVPIFFIYEIPRRFGKIGFALNKNDRILLEYRNKYLNKKCYIVGNGPSLTIKDLELLKDEYTFGCNRIYKCFKETSWRPNFLVITDNLVLKNSLQEIDELIDVNLFTPKLYKYIYNFRFKNSTYIYNRYKDYSPKLPPFGTSTFDLKEGHTVVYHMIQMAWDMGFREIYIIGVDNSYKLSTNVGTDGTIKASEEENYFIKGYMNKDEKFYPPRYDIVERGFLSARKYIESHSGIIKNATRGGNLEVLERISLEETLKTKV